MAAILQRQTSALVEDLRRRSDQEPEIRTMLEAEHRAAREGRRTAATYTVWREDVLPQVAVAWVLACVFVRFLEDNELIESPRLSGPVSPVDRRKHAIEAQEKYFQTNPAHNERDFLEAVFHDIARLPGMAALLGRGNANLRRFGPSREGCVELLRIFRELDEGEDPRLRHNFRDPQLSTRFLGDLYQNLSDHARKQYALLQTPDFIEDFILDRTLEPAIREFGLQGLRMIDPTVGSGHFLLGGFARLFECWRAAEPATEPLVLAQRVLDSLYGVDLNPFAAEICRFRLLIAALKASGVKRLVDAPAFKIHVAIGDSLLHGPRYGDEGRAQEMFEREWVIGFTYEHEDVDELRRVLGQRYHVVVGNPPYITVKDKSINALIRERYGSCKGKYALSVPFLERFVELAIPAEGSRAAGFVGQITANSFMKREFGKKLIEAFMPRWDLTHVIDTSGAYIPGHGTPTVILFLRNQQPVAKTVRAVLGIRGEPTTPDDAAQGHVWRAIVDQVDQPGSQSEFVSVEDKERAGFHQHPWSIGGGGAADLKDVLDEAATKQLGQIVDSIGITSISVEEELYVLPDEATASRLGTEVTVPVVAGLDIRDWTIENTYPGIWPYDKHYVLLSLESMPRAARVLWARRAFIAKRRRFGTPILELGMAWYEWGEIYPDKLRVPLSITYAEIATHNHFVLERGGRVFKQTAPVIKLPPGASEDDHLTLLGLLNSSTACFWLRQVCAPKGGDKKGVEGARVVGEAWEERHAFNATNLENFPICAGSVLAYAKALDSAAIQLRSIESLVHELSSSDLAAQWHSLVQRAEDTLRRMISLQEELDWTCYSLYQVVEDESVAGLDPAGVPDIRPGERAFEIVLARRIAAGDATPEWFTRHGSTPVTAIPDRLPAVHRELAARRIQRIESDRDLALIERPENKRRWNLQPFEARYRHIVRDRLLVRLEALPSWTAAQLRPLSIGRIAEIAGADAEFARLAEILAGHSAPDIPSLMRELLAPEHVPYLSALRYKDTGLRKRAEWEQTWALQRREDAIDARVQLPTGNPLRLSAAQAAEEKARAIGDIPVPPKYVAADFQQSSYWSNRGKLDVPKERFISYPGAETEEDPTLHMGWAGWDHAQQAQALATLYRERRQIGWDRERLRPFLAGLLELVPWLAQWHDNDPTFGDLGAFYRAYVETQCRDLGLEVHELSAWRPPAKRRGRKSKAKDVDEAETPPLFEAE